MANCYQQSMAQALIRKLDDDLLDDYRAAAKANGRSLEAELRDGLARSRPKRQMSREELTAMTNELWARTPDSAAAMDSTPFIRAMRDAR